MNKLIKLLKEKNKYVGNNLMDEITLKVLNEVEKGKSHKPFLFCDLGKYCIDLKLVNVVGGKFSLSKKGKKAYAIYKELIPLLTVTYNRLLGFSEEYMKVVKEASQIVVHHYDGDILKVSMLFKHFEIEYCFGFQENGKFISFKDDATILHRNYFKNISFHAAELTLLNRVKQEIVLYKLGKNE